MEADLAELYFPLIVCALPVILLAGTPLWRTRWAALPWLLIGGAYLIGIPLAAIPLLFFGAPWLLLGVLASVLLAGALTAVWTAWSIWIGRRRAALWTAAMLCLPFSGLVAVWTVKTPWLVLLPFTLILPFLWAGWWHSRMKNERSSPA